MHWIEQDERDIKRDNGDDNDNDEEENDREGNVRGMFSHESTLSQEFVDKLARKYGISNIYNCRAPWKEKYISDPKVRKIAITIAHLKEGFKLTLHPFFIWVTKKFWIQPPSLCRTVRDVW